MEFGVDLDQTAVNLCLKMTHGIFMRIHVPFLQGIILIGTKLKMIDRYNPHDMAVLNTVDRDKLPGFYDSLIYLSKKIEASPVWFKLQPGLIIFLDNWRMLHGRNQFTGQRKMCGCYISRSDWLSKCRLLLHSGPTHPKSK